VVFIAIVHKRNQGVYETVEGIREFEIFFLFSGTMVIIIAGCRCTLPLIAEGPNLKTKVAEVSALGRPCAFLNIDDAKLTFYLDKPYQVFYDEVHALEWATQADGVLITSSPVSDQSWKSVVKGRHWQAVIPRKVRPLEQLPAIPDGGELRPIEGAIYYAS
jgi:hypothetical protein